jgi:hypothetical protein
LNDGGIPGVRVRQDVDDLPFSAEDWTMIVMGSDLRRIAVDLGPQCADVLRDTEQWARDRQLRTVRVRSDYATAMEPFRSSRDHRGEPSEVAIQ